MSESCDKSISRRDLLKIAGVAGVAAQAGALVVAGHQAGKSSETYTGWESFNAETQFFNRLPFEFEGPAHKPVGDVRRPSHLTDYVFGQVGIFQNAVQANPSWKLGDPIENLQMISELKAFYKEFPERLGWDFKTFSETIPNNFRDRKAFGSYYLVASYGKGDGFSRSDRAYQQRFAVHAKAIL